MKKKFKIILTIAVTWLIIPVWMVMGIPTIQLKITIIQALRIGLTADIYVTVLAFLVWLVFKLGVSAANN